MNQREGARSLASAYAADQRPYLSDPQTSLGDELRLAFAALWYRKWLIVLIVVIFAVAALAYTRSATPQYTAFAELLIDPREQSLTEDDVVPGGLGTSALGADTALVESQVSLLQSESLIGELIDRLDLENDPEFASSSGGGIGGLIRGAFRSILYGDAAAFERSTFDQARRNLGRELSVSRVGNTYVIRIESRSEDPNKAALIANTLAELYLGSTEDFAESLTLSAADQFDERLEDLRVSWTMAAHAVEEYRSERGLIDAEDLLVIEQQLRDANTQFSAAQLDVAQTRAALEQARLSLSAPLEAQTGGGQGASVASNLRSRLADAAAQERAALTVYLPQHPTVVLLREQRLGLERALRAELAREVARLETAFNIASENVTDLAARIDLLQSQNASAGSEAIRLRELEGEAEISRELYERFLERSMEVNEQVGLQNDLTRVISEAYPASRPSHPKGVLVMLAGLMAGGMVGVAVAWLLHILNGTPVRNTTQQRPTWLAEAAE